MSATGKRTICLLVVLCGVAVPATANAATAPPGNSGVNEYLETLPAPDGDHPTSSPTGSGPTKPADPAESLGQPTTKRFRARGPVGRAAADLAAATRPDAGGTGSRGVAVADQQVADGGRSGLSQILGQLTGAGSASDGGMGLLLLLLLLGVAAAATGFVVARRRAT